MTTIGTINEEGVNVDLYIPRKCHASNTLIPAFDYAAIQLNIGDIDANGVYVGTSKTLCIAGFLRAEAESDHAINRLCITHGVIRARTGKPKKTKKRLPARQPAGQKGKAAPAARPGRGAGARPAAAGQKGGRGAGSKPSAAPQKGKAAPAAADKKAAPAAADKKPVEKKAAPKPKKQ